MNLKEYQGKRILKEYGISVPKGVVSDNKDVEVDGDVVVKAQLLIGGRGKAGLIKTANKDNVKEIVSSLLGKDYKGLKINEVLIEEKLDIEKEMYASIIVNRADKCLTLVFSEQGGVDIEQLAKTSPDKVKKKNFYDISEIKGLRAEVFEIVKRLYKIMKEKDATLVEINPLVVSKGKLIAADSKIKIDDNALYRQKEFSKEQELSEIEQLASKDGLQYVELDGNIAVIGNGAGLVMATLDVLEHFKGKAANFLDVGGGASVEVMEKSLEIVLKKKEVKGIFINIFGGITRCDNIANGLVNYLKKKEIKIPLVVRMIGTNEQEAKKILQENNIPSLDSMEECAKKIVELVK